MVLYRACGLGTVRQTQQKPTNGGIKMRRLPIAAFETKRNQVFFAWTEEQFNRAIRLEWVMTTDFRGRMD
jgi:hypothetical protein